MITALKKLLLPFLFTLLCSTQLLSQVDSIQIDKKDDLSFLELIEFDDISDLSLEELMGIKLKTGSFLELDIQNSPVSMTIITSAMLQNSGARHLSEALEIYVPGFQYMNNKWNGIIWGMRGVAPNRNTKFIFLVNGHKMNHESRDGAMSELDLGLLSDIDRIEVLRGPAGMVYGSGAIAGVINIVTTTYNKDETMISTSLHTWNFESNGSQIEGIIHREISENANFTFNAGYRKSNGVGTERSRIYGRGSWPYPNWLTDSLTSLAPENGVPSSSSAWSTPGNFKSSIDFKYKNFRLYSRATHQVTNSGSMFATDLWPEIYGVPDSTAPNRSFDGRMISPEDPFYSQIEPFGTNRRQYVYDNISTQLSYKKSFRDNTLTLNAGFDRASNKIKHEDQKAYTFASSGERTPFIEETFGECRYNLDGMYHYKPNLKFQMVTGYQLRVFDIGNDLSGKNEQSQMAAHPVVTDVVYTNNAFYTEGLYNITNKLHINWGLRYDLHTRTKIHGGILSPTAALVFNANPKNTIKIIYQTSANNGSADNYEYNRFHYSDAGEISSTYRFENPANKPTSKPDVLPPVDLSDLRALRPEKSKSYEIASVHHIAKSVLFVTSTSYTNIKDLFVWNQTLFREQNGGQYNTLNIDLEFRYNTNKINFGLSHTYQQVINSNINQTLSYEVPIYAGFDSTLTNGTWNYHPVFEQNSNGEDSMETVQIYPIQSISADGQNFTSLAKNCTKLFVDFIPNQWLTLHSNLRIFHGLEGRKLLYNQNYPDLETLNKAIIKWNASIQLKANEQLNLGLYIYDILGTASNARHTIRWQQYGTSDQTDLYSIDFRSYRISLKYNF